VHEQRPRPGEPKQESLCLRWAFARREEEAQAAEDQGATVKQPDTATPERTVTEEASPPPRCFYVGSWTHAGMYLWNEQGRYPKEAWYVEFTSRGEDRMHLDSSLAPRRMKRTGELCWCAMRGKAEWQRIHYDSEEYPLGQFLRHVLDTGFTAIQWWDRYQGDSRGGINSTILLEGNRTSEEVIAAMVARFPRVAKNLTAAGVELVEVPLPGCSVAKESERAP
jgi:hypothetical protein